MRLRGPRKEPPSSNVHRDGCQQEGHQERDDVAAWSAPVRIQRQARDGQKHKQSVQPASRAPEVARRNSATHTKHEPGQHVDSHRVFPPAFLAANVPDFGCR